MVVAAADSEEDEEESKHEIGNSFETGA